MELIVIPLGLHIPVGWRLPSYKVKRSLKYLKTSFIFNSPFNFVIPLGLYIPVGWRLPSYKILKGSKELKASFSL